MSRQRQRWRDFLWVNLMRFALTLLQKLARKLLGQCWYTTTH
jgi:hypothetical protein